MKNTWSTQYPQFKPDYTPVEMAKLGIFKGAYFSESRLRGSVLNLPIEFDSEFLNDEWHNTLCGSANVNKNLYKVDCGMNYDEWESRGWINDLDPYGWYHWYIKFYYGRRCSDDSRQIGRWSSFVGRHFGMLKYQCQQKHVEISNTNVGLKTRQNLLHWAYKGY